MSRHSADRDALMMRKFIAEKHLVQRNLRWMDISFVLYCAFWDVFFAHRGCMEWLFELVCQLVLLLFRFSYLRTLNNTHIQ